MAARGGERRLVFDVRGRRRHVVRFVYAILALLMASSLFFVVGPFNLSSLFGRGSVTPAYKLDEEQAEKIEQRLARDPKNPALLLNLARTRFLAGNARIKRDPTTGAQETTPEAAAEYERGLAVWKRYLKQVNGKPDPLAAETVAGVYNSLAETATTVPSAEASLGGAAKAEAIAAERQPTLHSLSVLAYYQYRAGDFAAGDRASREARGKAASKTEAKAIATQLAKFRKEGKEIHKRLQSFVKLERKKGKEALQNPLGGLAGGSGSLGP